MKFYVDILGFEDNIRTIEIYPTSNSFDLGFTDVYTMETSFNDITFQCRYNEDVFSYFPASNNEGFQLKTNMNHTTSQILLTGSRTLEPDETLWIENERVKINSELATNFYEIERGINGSIPVSHFYTVESNNMASIPVITATKKRLSPLGLICKFYKTNNIGGDIVIFGYGQISSVKLANNRILNVTCKQLPSMLDKTYIYQNNTVDEYVKIYNFIKYDNTEVAYLSTEFFRLLNVPAWFEFNFYMESKKFKETSTTIKTISFKDVFNQLLIYNNSFIKFDKNTGAYTVQKMEIPSSLDTTVSNVFLSSYLNINDFNVEIEPFQRASTIECKLSMLSKDEEGKLVSDNYEMSLKDDIISSVSDKTIKFDLSDLFMTEIAKIPLVNKKVKDKIYFINQIYDKMTVNTTKWIRKFEIGKRYIFNDKHVFKTLVDKAHNTIWLCIGYDDLSCAFISMESFNRYLISPFRRINHSTGDIWTVNALTLPTSQLIDPYRTYETGDTVYVYTYKKSDQTVTVSTKTLTLVQFASNYRLTISGLSTDSDYVHFISYNYNYLTTKNKLFLYENNGIV